MRVNSRRKLDEYGTKHADAQGALEAWYITVSASRWQTFMDVRHTYATASSVGRCVVFNIRGNNYRLITEIDYSRQTVRVKEFFTHAEYDRDSWKRHC